MLDPMIVRVGDEQPVAADTKAQRMLQPYVVADAVDVAELEEVAARDRPHLVLRRQRHRADDVGFRVGDEELAAESAKPEGWAKAAASTSPSCRPSAPVPA